MDNLLTYLNKDNSYNGYQVRKKLKDYIKSYGIKRVRKSLEDAPLPQNNDVYSAYINVFNQLDNQPYFY